MLSEEKTASSAAFAVGYESGMPKRREAEPWPPLEQAVSSDEAGRAPAKVVLRRG